MAEQEQESPQIDVDSLMEQVEKGEETNAGEREAPATPTPTVQEFEFTANGKPIKVPYGDERLKQWASQGHDYSQKMADFKRQSTEFESRRAALDKQYEPYKTVDDYAKSNPDWWARIQETFNKREAPVIDPTNPLSQEFNSLKSTLTEQQKFLQELQQERVANKEKQEDSVLDAEIESVRKTYPNIDLQAVEPESGKTLERRVLEFQAEHKMAKFDHAFKLFNHDRLQSLYVEQGKESVLKEKQKLAKVGIIGKSPTPSTGLQPAKNLKNTSYDDLMEEGYFQETGKRLG